MVSDNVAFTCAVVKGYFEIVKTLLEWKDPSGNRKFVDLTVSYNYCYQFVSDDQRKNHPNEEKRKDYLKVEKLLIA